MGGRDGELGKECVTEGCEEAVVRWLCEGPAGAAVHLHEMTSMVSGHGSFFYTQ